MICLCGVCLYDKLKQIISLRNRRRKRKMGGHHMNKRRQTRRTALLLALLVLLQLTGCGRGEEITRGSFGGPAQFAQEHQQSQSEDAEEGPKEEKFHSGQPFGGSPFPSLVGG